MNLGPHALYHLGGPAAAFFRRLGMSLEGLP